MAETGEQHIPTAPEFKSFLRGPQLGFALARAQLQTLRVAVKMFLLNSAVAFALLLPASAAEIWVAPGGSDAASGTREQPLASIAAAQRRARDLRRLGTAPTNELVKIFLRGGIYRLENPLQLHAEDSGLQLEAAPGEHPVLSGGVPIAGWKKLKSALPGLQKIARGKIWVADAPRIGGRTLEFRQLWIGDFKAVRARTPNGDAMSRLIALDKTNQTMTVPLAALGGVRDAASLEMVIQQIWEIAVLRVASVKISGDSARLTFHQPESKLEFEHPWPPPVMSTNGNAPFYFVNRLEFLDEPGEWFEDVAAGKIYYWPRAGEELAAAERRATRQAGSDVPLQIFAPAIETLVEISGTSDAPVENVSFKNISFEHASWLRPSWQGHVPLQAGMFLLDAYKLRPPGVSYNRGLDNQAWIGRPPAAVTVRGANRVRFERCHFEQLASAGLDFTDTTHDDLVQGCVFRDIGGNGLQLGTFSDAATETHIPFNPSDEREISARENISNNAFTDCANEDWGCVGVAVGYARNVTIAHNDISQLPYTGISVGWGWTKATNCLRGNFILANRVHHIGQRLTDLGGIYTLSAQPGTVVAENSVTDIRMSEWVSDPNHWFYLYLDEGSSGITVRNNFCPAEKFLKNANGPGNVWTNNGPQVPAEIKSAAGIESAWRAPR